MFDFFKKKKTSNETVVQFEEVLNDIPVYSTWNNSAINPDNDFVNTVFLNIYETPKHAPTTPDEFPRYVSYTLDVHNPIKKFNELLSNGFLERAENVLILNSLKLAELKEVLEKHNIPSTGRKKADLIDKITETINVDDLKLPDMYVLSSKGIEYIEIHKDLLQLFGNPYGVKYEEYAEAKAAAPYMRYGDIVWGLFNKREMEFSLSDNAGRSFNASCRAKFLESENRLVDALFHYIVVLYYDVNSHIVTEENSKKFNAAIGEKYEEYKFSIAPSLLEAFERLKDYYLDEMIPKCYRHHFHPMPKINKTDFECLVRDVLEKKEIDLHNYYK